MNMNLYNYTIDKMKSGVGKDKNGNVLMKLDTVSCNNSHITQVADDYVIYGNTINGNTGTMQIQQDCIGSAQVATQPFSNYLTTRDTTLKDEIIDELLKKLTAKPVMLHNCNNCGGQLEMKENEHIFKCPYCGAVYFIGTEMINQR